MIVPNDHKVHLKARDNKNKLNIFKFTQDTLDKSKTRFSQSMHSTGSRKNVSLNITLSNKGRINRRNNSNSCSIRNSPFNQTKLRSINLNESSQSSHT